MDNFLYTVFCLINPSLIELNSVEAQCMNVCLSVCDGWMEKDVENELVVQVSMKQEMEMAMKLLEKDIHEKQDTLIGLRNQLDDVKTINVEMYQKMQVRLMAVLA